MERETPSTALSVTLARPERPAEKCLETSRVSMIGESAAGLLWLVWPA